jgi:hypothetical protein
MTSSLVAITLSLLCGARILSAQALTNIGATSAGTPVFLEPKSISRAGGIVTATLRVAIDPPMKTAGRAIVSLRSTSMINCAAQTSATKERWFYYDAKFKTEARHDTPGIPGYGPAIKGSLADVALKHFCTTATKK